MKLYRRKPTYAMAMQVHRDENFLDLPQTEWAIQPCDESGKPLSTHMIFVSDEEFKRDYDAFRVRPKAKAPIKRNHKPTKKAKIESVNLKDVEEVTS